MPRIKLITDKAELPAEQHAEYDRIVEILGRVGGPFGVLLNSPGLAQKVCEAGAQVRLGSTLTPVERELCIIAVSREKDAAYEWAAHVRAGRAAGMREEAIEVVRHRRDDSALERDERDVIDFVRQLLRTNRVEQSLFDELVKRHGVRWLVEVAATAGQYQYISAINNTFDLQPAPDADQLPV
ncbi:MAG TPA: carboxymuconolactone decarboxylase family protein [Dehalococcoidia bacterium]|nr:carboxymuconolactone decarboxylase family protein [Dehalococcoidia bacterium]